MAAELLALKDISLTFGGQPLLDGVDLSVRPGDRIALVGRNGSGKSTLLKIAAGLIEPDAGQVFTAPGATVRYLPQEPDLAGFDTVLAFVEAGLTGGDPMHRAQYLVDHLKLDGDKDPKTLSGGEARRAALARTLAPEPDILLLDEPTNHLDLPAIEWLESELVATRSAFVLISHDRRFLTDLTRETIWLDRGMARALDDGFAGFESWRDRALEEEEQERHKLDREIVREEHWVRYGVTARRKRNVRRMAELAELRRTRRDARQQIGTVALSVASGKTSGQIVIDAENLEKGFDGRPIVSDFSTRVLRGDRLGIVGPNGAGKTTLVKLLTGTLAPDAGTVKLGTRLDMAMLDQRRDALKPEMTLKDALTGGNSDWVEINGQKRHFAAYMKDFLFAPEQAGTSVARLSGGERARVTLARALSLPSNLLVLDEPTNDLDLETLDLLQELVADYAGTVIVVSHDRDFLDRVATATLIAEGDGGWTEYAGGYSDMVALRGHGVLERASDRPRVAPKRTPPLSPPAASKPKKLSFKQLHALKQLPATMESLQAELAGIERKLADPALFNRDPGGFSALTERHEAARAELAAAENEWLELELLREELGG
ncbi:MAG: ATP-binding cassette domain-containing protein [Alphaproteobacteria bacterium]|nr:ATP-binding cassette domain-containing protein [Alphaproteobacteria bacterium]